MDLFLKGSLKTNNIIEFIFVLKKEYKTKINYVKEFRVKKMIQTINNYAQIRLHWCP